MQEDAAAEVCISNVGLVGVNAESPFAGKFEPDASKAFLEFDICHSVPDFAGPVGMGAGVVNYTSFFPATLEQSAGSLQYQQLNLRHLLRAYGSEAAPVANDRIVGCVVAAALSKRKPMAGWRAPGKPDGETCSIKACAVVFKLAAGVGKMIGDHLTGRQAQSVSIEVTTGYDNLGVYRPSTDELVPLLEPSAEIFAAYTDRWKSHQNPMPQVGQIDGEQLLVIYGTGGPVHFRGVGVTPNPAERAAEIVGLWAEQDGYVGIAAEKVTGAAAHTLVGRKVTFHTKRVGEIKAVHTSGRVRLAGQPWRLEASVEVPLLEVEMGDGKRVLRRYPELVEMIF